MWDIIKHVLTDLVEVLFYLQNRVRLYFIKIKNNLVIEKGVRIVPLSHFWVGKNVHIARGTILDCGGQFFCDYKGGIKIGNNTYIGHYCVLLGGGFIEIGKKVLISPGVIITTQGHFFQKTDRFMKDQPTLVAKIVIEDDVWIGANATILPGVKVGKGSVIGAGSIVNRDIPEYSVAAGVPAKVIRNRRETV